MQPVRLGQARKLEIRSHQSYSMISYFCWHKTNIYFLKYKLNSFRWHTSSNQQLPIFSSSATLFTLVSYLPVIWILDPRVCPAVACALSWETGHCVWCSGWVGVRVMPIHMAALECEFTWERREYGYMNSTRKLLTKIQSVLLHSLHHGKTPGFYDYTIQGPIWSIYQDYGGDPWGPLILRHRLSWVFHQGMR